MEELVWDTRPLYIYAQTPKEYYEVINARYEKFLNCLSDIPSDPVIVFDPLRQKQIDELKLIRDISVVLQAKKDDEIKKSKSAAEDTEKEKAEQEEAKEAEETETKK